jgi:hypothetical protein
MPRIAKNGSSGMFGGLRSPMATTQHGLIKGPMKPAVADNTMDPRVKTGAARVRSAQTAGNVVKPF